MVFMYLSARQTCVCAANLLTSDSGRGMVQVGMQILLICALLALYVQVLFTHFTLELSCLEILETATTQSLNVRTQDCRL